jgi:hypothetical protein
MDEKVTKPTIETVLERMAGMEERLNQRTDAVEGRLNQRIDGMEERLSVRLDRIEGVADTTRGEMLDMRADFREWRTQLKEHIPALR